MTTLEKAVAVSYEVIHLAYDLAIQFLGIYPRQMQTYVHKKASVWVPTATLFLVVQPGNSLDVHQQANGCTALFYP